MQKLTVLLLTTTSRIIHIMKYSLGIKSINCNCLWKLIMITYALHNLQREMSLYSSFDKMVSIILRRL